MTAAPDLTPLCVDLDGTLIRTDVLQESIFHFLKRNPFRLFFVLIWFIRGRAYLKQQLALRVQLDPAQLPINEVFLSYLRAQKERGVPLYLVSASDQRACEAIASFFGIFTATYASDGKRNLRSHAKGSFLTQTFGERGFIYAGNSRHDLPVWRAAKYAIAVNTPSHILQTLYEEQIVTAHYFENHCVSSGLVRLIDPRAWIKNLIFTLPLLYGGLFTWGIEDFSWAFLSFSVVDAVASTLRCFLRLTPDRSKRASGRENYKDRYYHNPLATGQIYLSHGFQVLLSGSACLFILLNILDDPYDTFLKLYLIAALPLSVLDLQKKENRVLQFTVLSIIIASSTVFYFFA